MAVSIRRVEIQWFRGVNYLAWYPSPGINCLVGPGDSGKSTVLDAIDLCLGARRTVQFSDSDFYELDTTRPIVIKITLGNLTDELRSIETYGQYLGGFDPVNRVLADEPAHGIETVLTARLTVGADLEPVWDLVSERAAAAGIGRNFAWKDRLHVAPLRIGSHPSHNFSWQRGSILTRLADEELAVSGALTAAARLARDNFGSAAEPQLKSTLQSVATTAARLGVRIGQNPRALLDAHATSFTAGGIALHTQSGVPFRNLGTGSTRLLVAGLQQNSTERVSIVLVDEVEHGVEPHRIIRLLRALGAKQSPPASQCFMTTHSPVVVRELSAEQLVVFRNLEQLGADASSASGLGADGVIRSFPDALLARAVIVCEGATEVGFVRGLDLYREERGYLSLSAQGAALVDGGGDIHQVYRRACAFQRLDYPVLVLRDSDVAVPVEIEAPFLAKGCVVSWRPGNCLEVELFQVLPSAACMAMVQYAHELHSDVIRDHILTAAGGHATLGSIWNEGHSTAGLSPRSRQILGVAASGRRSGWFKQISAMEHVAWKIVGPAVGPEASSADPLFVTKLDQLFGWIASHGA
jgi:putative ATP-dependent endonuclease of OLD family